MSDKLIILVEMSTESTSKLRYVTEMAECRDFGNAISFSVSLAYDVIRAIEGGSVVRIEHIDGTIQKLEIGS